MQPCRRSYKIIDEDTGKALKVDNKFVMSPTDLCTIGMLDKLVDTGISVLKIEGRGRSPDYVDRVIRTYREALDAVAAGEYSKQRIKEWNQQLGTVFNRSMSDSFYRGETFVTWSGAYGNLATKTRVLAGVVKKYYPKISVAEVELQSAGVDANSEYQFTGPTTGIVRDLTPK